MRTKKELEDQIKKGNNDLYQEYFNVLYEEYKENLVEIQDTNYFAKTQGALRLLRELRRLAN